MTVRARGRRFIYHWFDYGFFSELNYMFLAILYCRLQNRKFVLSSKYSTVFHTLGWRDFFEPFCPEIDSRLLHFLDRRPLGPAAGLRARLNWFDKRLRRRVLMHLVRRLLYRDVEVVFDNWEALRALRKQRTVEMSADGMPRRCSLRDALAAINREVWHYNAATTAAIDASIAALSLPERYAALHIRRGDKWQEAAPIGELEYVKRLERVTSLQHVYVATDDFRSVEAVQRLRPSWQVAALCPLSMHGYFPQEYDCQPPDERGRRTLLLLTETEILKRADVFVGTFSSGLGTYQGIARDHHTYGVDSDAWLFEGGL